MLCPTHRCFDDSLEFVAARVADDLSLMWSEKLVIVHGIAHFPEGQSHAGEPFAHAWVEEDDLCWDAAMLDGEHVYYSVRRDEFYAWLRIDIKDTTRYTVTDAIDAERASGHFGPWEEKYLALMGDHA